MADSMWAVISPSGDLAWYRAQETEQVRQLVSGEYAPGAVDTAWVRPPLRVMASDVALIAPEHYQPNPVAGRVIRQLSGGRLTQPWRGHVALVEYEQDSGPGSIGEWLGPTEISPELESAITAAVSAGAQAGFFTCPCCSAVSYHPQDIEHGYCARCHWYTGDPELGPPHLAGQCPARSAEGA